MKAKWLFFDIGSTLVDESKCIEDRCEFITNENLIDAREFNNKVLEFAKTDNHPVKSAARYYGVEIPAWNTELEFLYPDVKPILKELSSKYKLGIIANQCLGVKDRLNNWDIGKYFDIIVSSAEEACEKPGLEIFNLALKRANCNPYEAIMIGDRLDNDIFPAQKIGMKTIWIKQGLSVYQEIKAGEEICNYQIDCLADLLKIL